ncbi:MAG: outer membrane beta-barrel protein [Bacteroidales bacterium]|nr:outer membrane beta-barrel protein [Bacteroidales bacterium]
MKKLTLTAGILLIPLLLNAQFEQKMSFSLSTGAFKTIGTKTYTPEWASEPDEWEPYQMPNYRAGIQVNGAIQLNISRHFSMGLDVGYLHAGSWHYSDGDCNYLYYEVYDTIADESLADGENELNLTNISIGLVPRYYFYPWEKFSFFVFAGFNMNFTKAEYNDNEWLADKEFGMLDPDDTGPYDPYLEENTGLGVISGFGAEYDLNDNIGFYLSAGYQFILLDEKNFKMPEQVENFHALNFQAGIRLSFLKSKKL